MYIRLLHLLPCGPYGNTALQTVHFFQLNILDLLPEIGQQTGNLYSETFKNILSLFIQLTGSPGLMRYSH